MSKTRLNKHNKKFLYRNKWYGYALLAPGFILLTIFVIVPFIDALYMSFTDLSPIHANNELDIFSNYRYILQYDSFYKSLGNVVLMTLIYTVIMLLVSFAFAHVIKKLSPRMASMTKIICYIPFLISGVLLSIIFFFIFSSNSPIGLINALRINGGQDKIEFGADGIWPYILIILPMIWGGFGYNSLVMLAGLLNIPKDYYEAAELDGANAWQKMMKITIPNMKNYFVLIIVNLITGGLQMFELPLMMTGGGPLEQTLTPVLFIYNNANNSGFQEGTKTAASILIMIPIALINLLVFKVIKSEKSMD